MGGRIGFRSSFEDFYGRAAYDRTAEVSVYVAPGRQRLGIGGELLGAAVQRALARGLSVPLGFIVGHNAPSLRLFGGFGFEPARNMPWTALAERHGLEPTEVLRIAQGHPSRETVRMLAARTPTRPKSAGSRKPRAMTPPGRCRRRVAYPRFRDGSTR